MSRQAPRMTTDLTCLRSVSGGEIMSKALLKLARELASKAVKVAKPAAPFKPREPRPTVQHDYKESIKSGNVKANADASSDVSGRSVHAITQRRKR